ncbi:MAG: DUF721 domain-containing protein [Yersinia sp. (in: enterobacteria)]|jgi:hypothetical protein
MRESRPQLLDVLFDDAIAAENGPLNNVQQHAVALLKLNRVVKGLLPSQLQPWCRVANYRQSVLVLEAGNASWLMRLRYEQPALLSALRAQILPSLSSINIRINPSLMSNGHNMTQNVTKASGNTAKSAPVRHLSLESAKELKALAKRSPEKLRTILERLATLAGESTNATKRDK